MKPKIAIDGPAGAGKSTIAKLLAKKLKFIHVDSGALYRSVTVAVLKNEVSFLNNTKMLETAKKCDLDIKFFDDGQHVFLNGEDVSLKIRENIISKNVSYVAKNGDIREIVNIKLKKICEKGGVIVDGRDIGTVVLPQAEVKFFLTASAKVRALRRHKELLEKGQDISISILEEEIKKRDEIDSEREIAPLIKAKDAIEIDTSDMNIEEVVNKLSEYINN